MNHITPTKSITAMNNNDKNKKENDQAFFTDIPTTTTVTTTTTSTTRILHQLLNTLRTCLLLTKKKSTLHQHLLINYTSILISLHNTNRSNNINSITNHIYIKEWGRQAIKALQILCIGTLQLVKADDDTNSNNVDENEMMKEKIESVVIKGVKEVMDNKKRCIWQVYEKILKRMDKIVGDEKKWMIVKVWGIIGEGWSWKSIGSNGRIGVSGNWRGNDDDNHGEEGILEIMGCLEGKDGCWKVVGIREKIWGKYSGWFVPIGVVLGKCDRDKVGVGKGDWTRISFDFSAIVEKEKRHSVFVIGIEWVLHMIK